MDSKALGDEAEITSCGVPNVQRVSGVPNVPVVQVVPDVKY
jgi:hypothetical protein